MRKLLAALEAKYPGYKVSDITFLINNDEAGEHFKIQAMDEELAEVVEKAEPSIFF